MLNAYILLILCLWYANLDGNSFTGTITTKIGRLRQLKIFNICKFLILDCLFVTKSCLVYLSRMFDFEFVSNHLSINKDGNDLKGTIPTEFGKLTSLTELVLGEPINLNFSSQMIQFTN